MNVLVTYDVSTETPEGRRRLRHAAQACLNYGQRVQKSVFECAVSAMQLEQLRHRLLEIIHPEEDSLRIYHLGGPRRQVVEAYGKDGYVDFEEPLLV